ncbi:MAG: hypothetical protein C0P68_007250 [Bacillota bacterium]|nr:hypothetical protein [Bacillota bacterium]
MHPAHIKSRRKREVAQPLLFRQPVNAHALAIVMQRVARAMAPFYRAIAGCQLYAKRWSEAVIDADLKTMEQLLRRVSPAAARQGLATNGIGYFVSFAAPSPIDHYTNGVTIPPGKVQFVFEPRAHRLLARHVLPFYETLAQHSPFSVRLAQAIQRHDIGAVHRLVRARIRTAHLRVIAIEDEGLILTFVFPFSRFRYQNVLFRDVLETDGDGRQE